MITVTLYRYVFDFRYALSSRQRAGFDPDRSSVEIYAVDPPEDRDERRRPHLARKTVTQSIQVEATPEESAAWIRARTAALDALRSAEQQLVHDLGMRIDGGFSPGLRRGSGWSVFRRRSRTVSRRAFDRLELRLRDITECYRPVREQIQPRVREAEARAREEQARLRKVQREREQRKDRFLELAAQTRWSYHVTESDRTVHVFRADDSTLTTGALIDELQQPVPHLTDYTVHWAATDRAEIERVSGAGFATWWAVVAPDHWKNFRRIPARPPTPSRPYIGGHSGYDGFSSCAGGSERRRAAGCPRAAPSTRPLPDMRLARLVRDGIVQLPGKDIATT